jgi:hypothetical protein
LISIVIDRDSRLAVHRRRPPALGVPNPFHLGACLRLIPAENIPTISVEEGPDPVVGDARDMHRSVFQLPHRNRGWSGSENRPKCDCTSCRDGRRSLARRGDPIIEPPPIIDRFRIGHRNLQRSAFTRPVGHAPQDRGHVRIYAEQGNSDLDRDQRDERPTGKAKTSVQWVAMHRSAWLCRRQRVNGRSCPSGSSIGTFREASDACSVEERPERHCTGEHIHQLPGSLSISRDPSVERRQRRWIIERGG